MSTLYNRRRGAKSYKKREPRLCTFDPRPTVEPDRFCIALAPRNRYCDEHQRT